MAAHARETREAVFPLNVALPFDATPEEHHACQHRLQDMLYASFRRVRQTGGTVADDMMFLEDYLKHDRVKWREEGDRFVFESVTVLVSRPCDPQVGLDRVEDGAGLVRSWVQLARDTWQVALDEIPGAKKLLAGRRPPVLFDIIRQIIIHNSR